MLDNDYCYIPVRHTVVPYNRVMFVRERFSPDDIMCGVDSGICDVCAMACPEALPRRGRMPFSVWSL